METITSIHGWHIPYHWVHAGGKKILLSCHGFGSSKAGTAIGELKKLLPPLGVDVISFDFPAHGESDSGYDGLRIPYCLDDLAEVERFVLRQCPGAEIFYFGSSFGAYNILLYLSSYPHAGSTALLRSSAVVMPEIVRGWGESPAMKASLEERGYFVPDHEYIMEMRVSRAFLDDLAQWDVFERYRPGTARLRMIHGVKDSVAPYDAAVRFAEYAGAELVTMPEGDHPLMGPGEMERMLELAVETFVNG